MGRDRNTTCFQHRFDNFYRRFARYFIATTFSAVVVYFSNQCIDTRSIFILAQYGQ